MKEPKKILVCDDDAGIVEILSLILKQKGFLVTVCDNGDNVYRLIEKEHPDLLILDLWMPGEGGETICQTLKTDERTKHIPILIMSANQETAAVSQRVAADDYIEKPFDLDMLEKKINTYI